MRDIDRYQREYLANYGFERHMVRYRRKAVLKSLAQYPHRCMLEVGCGAEPLFEHFDDWDDYTIVEPGGEFAERARSLLPVGRNAAVVQSLIEDAGAALAGQRFDFIVLSSLLHEVSDPATLLAAVRALSETETVVHVNVPNARSLHNRLAVKMGLITDIFAQSPLAERMQRTSTFDMARLMERVERSGFRVDSSGSYFLKPFTHGQLQQMLDDEIIDERVLDALFEMSSEYPDAGSELYVNMRKA